MAGSHATVSDTLPPVEATAEQLHDTEMRQKKNSGIHEWKANPDGTGENLMVPYAELSDGARGSVNDRVQTVYSAIDAAAEEIQSGGRKTKAGRG